jgi:hypothetical protein
MRSSGLTQNIINNNFLCPAHLFIALHFLVAELKIHGIPDHGLAPTEAAALLIQGLP